MSPSCQTVGKGGVRENLQTNRRSWGMEHTQGDNSVCVSGPPEEPEPPVLLNVCPDTEPTNRKSS